MSRMNIQNLLKIGEPQELRSPSPGSPGYKESSFRGGQFQVGGPRQQIGPSAEESMYGALAEVAGGVKKGIDIFTDIRTRIEKTEIEKARAKFKEIYSGEYVEEGQDPDTATRQFRTPEEKLSEWNSYIKDVWTPLLGSTWIDEINLEAYTAFGSREAQEKFEADRYARESYLFFTDSKNKLTLNQNSSVAKMQFDAYYLDKYPSAAGNFWFKAKQQENLSQYQNEEDNLALESLPLSLADILSIPSPEIAAQIASGSGAESQTLQARFGSFYTEIFPIVRKMEDQRDIYATLYNYYYKHLIEENPKQYQPHTLVALQRALPKVIQQQVQVIRDIKAVVSVAETVKQVQENSLIATAKINENFDQNKDFHTRSLVHRASVEGQDRPAQQGYLMSGIVEQWSTKWDATTRTFNADVSRNGLISGLSESNRLEIEAKFSILEGIEVGSSIDLNKFTPDQQYDILAALSLEAILSNSVSTQQAMAIFDAKDESELIDRFKASATQYKALSKPLQEANNQVLKERNEATKRVIDVMGSVGSLSAVQDVVNNALTVRAEQVGLPVELFRSIYTKTNLGLDSYTPDWDLTKWYGSLSPENKEIVDKSGFWFNRENIRLAAQDAFNIELKAIEIKNKADGSEDKSLENARKEIDKIAEQSLKISSTSDITRKQTQGDVVIGYMGSLYGQGEAETREYRDLLTSYSLAMDTLPSIDRDSQGNYVSKNGLEKAHLDILEQINALRSSDNPIDRQLADKLEADRYAISAAMAKADLVLAPLWQSLSSQLQPSGVTTTDPTGDFNYYREQFKKSYFNGDINFDGSFDLSKALNTDGTLSQYSFNWLMAASLTFDRQFGANDTRLSNGSAKQVGDIVEKLLEYIPLNPDPQQFLDNKANILPYMAFIMMGKMLDQSIADEGLKAYSGAGWFMDRLAIAANVSATLNYDSAIQYFASDSFRQDAAWTYNLPFTLARFGRNTDKGDASLLTPTTEDQVNLAKPVLFQAKMFGYAGIYQSSSAFQIAKRPVLDRQTDAKILMNTIFSGKPITPRDPNWSADIALDLWKKAGLVEEGMTKEKFAEELEEAFLKGSVLPDSATTPDEKIRLAFIVIDDVESRAEKSFGAIIGMATDPQYGIHSSGFPGRSSGSTKSNQFLPFYSAATSVMSAQESNLRDGVNLNNRQVNTNTISTGKGLVGRFSSVSGTNASNTYNTVSLTSSAYSDNPLQVEAYAYTDEYQGRFLPSSRRIDQTTYEEDGIPFRAGVNILESKPTLEALQIMLQPYQEANIRGDISSDANLPPMINSFIASALESSPTVFDALLKINDELIAIDLPPIVNERELYEENQDKTYNKNSIIRGAASVYQNNIMNSPDSMAFTFKWIPIGFDGKPLVHLPNALWSLPRTYPKNPRLDQVNKEAARQKAIEEELNKQNRAAYRRYSGNKF